MQRAGETVLVPGGWWHVVVNLEATTGPIFLEVHLSSNSPVIMILASPMKTWWLGEGQLPGGLSKHVLGPRHPPPPGAAPGPLASLPHDLLLTSPHSFPLTCSSLHGHSETPHLSHPVQELQATD